MVSENGQDGLAVSWDGTTVPLREKAPMRSRPAERPGVRETDAAPTAWKEAGVGTLFLLRGAPRSKNKDENKENKDIH